jgi:hypothetical protein
LGLDVWNGAVSEVQTYALGGGRNITYPLGLQASSVGDSYGLDRHSYIIIDQNGIIQYVSPQNVSYTRRYKDFEDEMKTVITNLLTPTDVKDRQESIPQAFKLHQNRPNPFRGTTTIQLDVSNDMLNTPATIKIYNTLGQEISSLFNGRLSAGNHTFRWNGLNRSGSRVPAGVYFYVLNAGLTREVKTLLYLAR